MGARLIFAARLFGRARLPFITVWVEKVGEVKGIVDSGAQLSIIRSSVVNKILAPESRTFQFGFLRGMGDKLVPIESHLPLNIKWEGSFVNIDRVAVVRDMPFAIILGCDWIIKSETDLLVRGGKIVLKPKFVKKSFQDYEQEETKKKVRFAGIEEHTIDDKFEEDVPCISDELIESIKSELPPNRSHRQALSAHLISSVSIPSESMLFCSAKVSHKFSGTGMVQLNHCSAPGKDFIIPSCLVTIKKGRFKIPILNLSSSGLKLRRRDLAAHVDVHNVSVISVVKEEVSNVGFCGTVVGESIDLCLNDVVLGEGLSHDQRNEILDLLRHRAGCLVPSGRARDPSVDFPEHHIDTGDARPVSSRPYRVSAFERRIIDEHVDRMLKEGVIQPSFSPWSAPVVLTSKKTPGEFRFCVDYRRLNALTKRDVYPLPSLDDVFDRLAGSQFYSSLDLRNGFHQIPVAPADRPKTGFVANGGLFEFVYMPFGLTNAPATFSRMMDRVLGGLKWQMCLVYLDDVLVFGKSFSEHLFRLNLVLEALEKAGLTLNVSKCIFATREIFHLGHIIDKNGIRPGPEKVRALEEYVIKDVKSLKGFLGLASFFRRFVKNFGATAGPLNALLKKKKSWCWGPAQEAARSALVSQLTSAPVLAHFDDNLPVVVQTDASHAGLGAVLLQDDGKGPRPVAYISRRLTDAETRYHANELECLAVVWALKKFRAYVYGRKFCVQTDSSAVRWLCEKRELTGKFARWILCLQEYDFTISHIKGIDNCVADALSRDPVRETEKEHLVCTLTSNKLFGYSAEELSFQQRLDPQLKPIFDVFGMRKSTPCSRKLKAQFVLHSGILYKRNSGRGRNFLLCVPSPLRRQVLESCHDDPCSGHLGVGKTFNRVAERFWWPRLGVGVRVFVLSCMFCQFHKHQTGRTAGLLEPIPPPSRPFESLNMDHLGPFKTTADGNRHILVIVDYLSKWVEATAVPDTSSKHVIKFLKQSVFCRHGVPVRIISDQGTAFTSHEMEEATAKWKVKHVFATAEHPQTSGLVERGNRTLTLAISAFINVLQNDWDDHLASAIYAINTARHSTTEQTPFEMVYGRLPNTSLENEFCWPPESPEPHSVFMERVRDLREAVKLRIIEKQKKVKQYVDGKRRVVRDLCPGELVLVRRNLSKKGKTKKFLPKFIGPFQVVKKVCPTTYLVEDVPHRRRSQVWRRFRAHICQIRKFRVREDNRFDEDDGDPDDPKVASIEPPIPAFLPHQPPIQQSEVDPPPPLPPQINNPVPITPPVITRSGRTSHPSSRLKDFVR